MKKTGKVLNLIGIVISLIAIVVSAFFVADSFINNKDIIRSNSTSYRLLVCLIPSTIFNIVCFFKRINRNLLIAGVIINALFLYSSFGITLLSMLGYLIIFKKLNDMTKKDNDDYSYTNDNEIINERLIDRYKKADYKLYINKHKISYAFSFVMFFIIEALVIYLTIIITKKMVAASVEMAAIPIAIFGFFYYSFIIVLEIFYIINFVFIIIALANPSRVVLKTNKILGIVSFTIFNSIASNYILKEVDLDIKNKTENNYVI